MADRAADGFFKALDKRIHSTIEHLNGSVEKASHELQYVTRNKTWRNLAIGGLSCLLCLSVGYSAAYFLAPPQTVELSDKALEIFNSGRLMQAAWPRLTKVEQEKILKLGNRRSH